MMRRTSAILVTLLSLVLVLPASSADHVAPVGQATFAHCHEGVTGACVTGDLVSWVTTCTLEKNQTYTCEVASQIVMNLFGRPSCVSVESRLMKTFTCAGSWLGGDVATVTNQDFEWYTYYNVPLRGMTVAEPIRTCIDAAFTESCATFSSIFHVGPSSAIGVLASEEGA